MNFAAFSLIKALPLASLIALGNSVGAIPHRDEPLRIMPLGDSLTSGGIASNGIVYCRGAYRKQMAIDVPPHLNFEFVGSERDTVMDPPYDHFEGHGGWTLMHFIGELKTPKGYPAGDESPVVQWVRAAKPDIILFDAGTNDNGCGLNEFVRRYTKLFNQIYSVAPNVKIVWALTLPKLQDKTGAMLRDSHAAAPIVKKAFPDKVIAIVDPGVGFDPATMTCDGAHPNDTGEPFLVKAMEQGLQQITGYK